MKKEKNIFNDMKNNWSTKKLGEVADVIMGQSPPSSSYNERGEGLPFFQGKAEFGETYPTPVKYCSSPSRIAEENDILISVRAPVGNINIASEKSCVGRGLGALRAKKNILNQMFLFYFMKKNENNWSQLSTGSTFSAIKGSGLKNFEIPLPPLAVQKQIVERLDKIAEAQKLNDDLIQKSDELYRSLLHNELNVKFKNQNAKSQFKIKKLGEVAEVTSSKRIYQSEYVEGGIPFYRTKEIVELSQNKQISLEFFISEKRFNEIRKKFCVPRKEDILISAVGTIGISWIVPDDREFYFKDGNLLWIRKLKDMNPLYLKIVLDNFAKNIAQMGAGGAYNALTIIKLKNVKIPLPPLKTQKQIVVKLSAAQGHKTQLLAQKAKLKELFNSVLARSMNSGQAKSFSGQ